MHHPIFDKSSLASQWHPEGRAFTLLVRYARSRLQHPAKLRLIRFLDRLLHRKTLQFSGGGRLAVRADDYIYWALLTQGCFEPRSLALAVELMRGRRQGAFVDVGAHYGLFSVAVGMAAQCKVIAIEPARETFQTLMDNVLLNPGLDIHPVNCCASSRDSLLQLSSEGDGRSAWTRVHTDEDEAGKPYIPGLTLNLILERLQAANVRLLKIDVEGYELEVFRGLDWNGVRRPELVLMECNPNEHAKRQFLLDRGYSCETVDGHKVEEAGEYPEGNLLFRDITNRASEI